jgi:hypothetical protein
VIDLHVPQRHVVVRKALLEFLTACGATEAGRLPNRGNHFIFRFTENSSNTIT